jgi:hypothetical protein
MATTNRILATVGAALFAGLTLVLGSAAPAAAQATAEASPAQTRPGRPLNLVPQFGKAKKLAKQTRSPTRVAKTETTPRAVQRRAPTRTFARRQNARAVASRQDERSVLTPDPDSLGYQAESKTQPPIDAWLRSPLPAAAPVIARPRATPTPATVRDQFDTPVTLGGPAAEAPTADISTADQTITDLTTDTVQVADAGEINEIDLAANETPTLAASETPAPVDKSRLNSLLAVLGGAFAAAAAASFLFARRRKPLRLSF